MNCLRVEDVGSEPPDTSHDIGKCVLTRIDRPNDVVHFFDYIPGGGCNLVDHRRVVRGAAEPGAKHIAQNGYSGETGTDVVVQIGCDAGAGALDREPALQYKKVDPIRNPKQCRRSERQEPPALPNRSGDRESN